MSRNLEGVHVGFQRQIIGQKEVRKRYRTRKCVKVENLFQKAGTQYLGAYIDKQQETVVEWVALRAILEVYDK